MMRATSERGVALVAALMVMMLMSAMLAGFMVMVNADQAAGGIDRDQTQAYAAAHAGVEKLTADLGQLFAGNFSPTGAQLDALATEDREPGLPGISYVRPDGSSGYRIDFTDDDGNGNPDVADEDGTQISAGPYQGLVGLITPYDIEVTARTTGNAEVRMRRTMQTIAIPVFQFGIFSENDLSFFAGPNFAFGGRVHTNQNLYLKQDGTATLTLQDRVTAVGDVIRTELSNGVSGTHPGHVRVARASGCPAAPASMDRNACFELMEDQGSLKADGTKNTAVWNTVSLTTSRQWLRNGDTGATRLDLPIVSDGAAPIDIIRRPQVGEATNSAIGRQRFYNMATLRILLSDRREDLVGTSGGGDPLPGVVWTASGEAASPVHLSDHIDVSSTEVAAAPNGILPAGTHPFAVSTGDDDDGFRTTAGTPSIDGWILINRQDRDGNWTDVTKEILNLGFSGKRLSRSTSGSYGRLDRPNFDNDCFDAHPNAVIRVQRYSDTINNNRCKTSGGGQPTPRTDDAGEDFWPNVLYDPREGMLRDDESKRPSTPSGLPGLYWGGVMHYVELDVDNLRRWLNGSIGESNDATCVDGGGATTCPMDITGFVVYFSDRRTNRDFGADGTADTGYDITSGPLYTDDHETGEFGYEDIINPADSNSEANGVLDGLFEDTEGLNRWAEDVNQSTAPNDSTPVPEVYGGTPRLVDGRMLSVSGTQTPQGNVYSLYGAGTAFGRPIDRNVARVNRAFFFRRALKLVNGGRGNLPANGSQGLTVASENPVYVQGNYNACTDAIPRSSNDFEPSCSGGVGFGSTPGTDHVSAAVIADAVTFLSNAWNDIRSFRDPHDSGASGLTDDDARQASTTWYRLAIIGGKGLSFERPTNNSNDHSDFGTDGGAHNFIRYVENWGGATLNYRGSLVSFYTSRQAVGIYKCCNIVYSPPGRGYNFDTEFLNPNLLPPRTPMFRDINTLTFRQILRPTQ